MPVVLLGDSIFRRLFETFPDKFSDLSREVCISGQTTSQLKVVVKSNRDLLRGQTVILHIGTSVETCRPHSDSSVCKSYSSNVTFFVL